MLDAREKEIRRLYDQQYKRMYGRRKRLMITNKDLWDWIVIAQKLMETALKQDWDVSLFEYKLRDSIPPYERKKRDYDAYVEK